MQELIELDDDTAFGARLRAERERLGLEVHELAHLSGRPDITQKRYEAGSTPIPIDYLQALHARSDVDVWYLVTGRRSSERGR
ncbi:helix-turn-helix transcriptional regulator [Pseudomonas sp. SA3-5]|uniref:Helix-turn-helix transcriptional regulator n=1 Tax=Pseudomonas aestuarii TaxID=3018340 RepID=A0ABT4XEA6_9PSED|nr:helix-turn-helix transcriptional regulator [Pseudomonas aestuarii]MDA7086521.1 helix-turn-helix transcriptional regulator [Pseudomonas aestuarii]